MKVDADNRFAIVPEWILYHPDLSAQAVRLYGVLARHTDDKTRTGSPGRAKLAKKMSCSPDTVDRAVGELVAAGVVEVVNRWRDKTKKVRDSNLYLLKTAPPGGTDAATPSGDVPAESLTSDDAAPEHVQAPPGGTGAPTSRVGTPAATPADAPTPTRTGAVTPGGTDAEGSTESTDTESSDETTTAAGRPRDEIWDALERIYGNVVHDADRDRRNKATKLLRQASATGAETSELVAFALQSSEPYVRRMVATAIAAASNVGELRRLRGAGGSVQDEIARRLQEAAS